MEVENDILTYEQMFTETGVLKTNVLLLADDPAGCAWVRRT